jgi:hypothetical protein
MLVDSDLASLKSFWMWEPFKEKWKYVRDWEAHKREAMQKFEEYVNGKACGIDAGDKPQPLKDWIQ